MDTFSTRLKRLKQALGVSKDVEVADLLGLSKTAFNERKRRDSFPEDKVAALAARRPELNIDVHFVLHGKSAKESGADWLDAFPARLVELRGKTPPAAFAATLNISEQDLSLLEGGFASPTNEFFAALVQAFPEHSPIWLAGGPRPKLDGELTDLEVVLVRNYRQCEPSAQLTVREQAAKWAQKQAGRSGGNGDE